MMEVQEQGQQLGEEEAEDEVVRFHDCCSADAWCWWQVSSQAASAFAHRPLSFILSSRLIL
jgi:hypothetical protein